LLVSSDEPDEDEDEKVEPEDNDASEEEVDAKTVRLFPSDKEVVALFFVRLPLKRNFMILFGV
jgi:hypothetical protein